MTFDEWWAAIILPTLDGYSPGAVKKIREVAEKAWRTAQKYAGNWP